MIQPRVRPTYGFRFAKMRKTRRYRIVLAVLGAITLAACIANATIVVMAIRSGRNPTPDTMSPAAFTVLSVLYWMMPPLLLGVFAVLVVHLVMPFTVKGDDVETDPTRS